MVWDSRVKGGPADMHGSLERNWTPRCCSLRSRPRACTWPRGGFLGTSARQPLRRHRSGVPTTENASSETMYPSHARPPTERKRGVQHAPLLAPGCTKTERRRPTAWNSEPPR
jgi:hypothetical protein